MSDIGVDFPIWVFVGFILAYALPVTTALLAPLVFARVFGGRRGTGRGARSLALDIAILVLAPPWLIGVVGIGWDSGCELIRQRPTTWTIQCGW